MLNSLLKLRFVIDQDGDGVTITLPDIPCQPEKFNLIWVTEVLAAFTVNSNEPKAVVLVQSPGFGGIGVVVVVVDVVVDVVVVVGVVDVVVVVGVVGLSLHPEKLKIRAMKIKMAQRFMTTSAFR